jgi:hypothetical protein
MPSGGDAMKDSQRVRGSIAIANLKSKNIVVSLLALIGA